MIYQFLFSPQVKRSAIISNKHGIYEFPHKWLNDLRLRIREYQENLKPRQNDSPMPSPPAKMKIFLKLAKNSWKTKIKPFPQCATWNPEPFPNIARMIVGSTPHIAKSRRYSNVKITDANYADDLAALSDYPFDATILSHHLEKASSELELNINSKKRNFYSAINIFSEPSNSNKKRHRDSIGQIMVSSKQTGFDIEVLPTSKPRKKHFQTTVKSVLAHRARSWTVTKSLEKAIDYAYTRMLRAVMKISWE